ncbi:MAG: EAL domain-containing protein [Treponema sp.]|nr:EAL domain-containing protein [Treponema sp.]
MNINLGVDYQPLLHYDFASIAILSIVIISMLSRKIVKGLSNVFFFQVVILTFLACLTDVFSEIPGLPISLKLICDYGYFIFTIMVPALYILYIYVNVGLWHHFKANLLTRIAIAVPLAFAVLILICNVFNHWAFIVTPEGNYIRGPMQPVLICCCLSYLIVGVIILIKFRKLVSITKFLPLMVMIPCVISGLFFQQFNQGVETTLFGLTIGILIISFTVQRHNEDIHGITGIKNETCAIEELPKVFSTNQNCCILLLKIKNQEAYRSTRGVEIYNKMLAAVSKIVIAAVKKRTHVDSDLYFMKDGTFLIRIDSCNTRMARNIAADFTDDLRHNTIINDVSISVDSRTCIIRVPDDIHTYKDLEIFRDNFDKKLIDTPAPVLLGSFIDSKDFKIKNEINEIITDAIENKRFEMYYQPIYSLKEKKYISAEALIRLNNPKYGFVSPAIFIPASESNGSIHEIGDYVIDSVTKFAAGCDMDKLGLKYIEYNLSSAQCIEMNLVEKLLNIAKKYQIKPEKFNLEITETASDFDPIISMMNIEQLNRSGFSISLDDYGTGYSNITRVIELPVEIVKLDKSFVDQMSNPDMWTAIEYQVKMFQEMEKKILVEGVEDEETVKVFERLGCDYIQGYHFSKPLPEKEFIEFIKEHNGIKN